MNQSIFGNSPPKFVFDYNAASKNFTVVAATNVFTCTSHGLSNGQRIKVTSTTTLPDPLLNNTHYYVKDKTTDTFKLALTRGGTEIDIIDTGMGTHSLNTEIEINLDYWVPISEDTDVKNSTIESQLEADRAILPRGEYLEIEGRINLYKYTDMATIQSKFTEIVTYKNKNVALWKHRDGDCYRDSNGDPVLFYVESVIARNFTTLDYRDILYIRFLSLKKVDLSLTTATIIPIEEIVMSNDY